MPHFVLLISYSEQKFNFFFICFKWNVSHTYHTVQIKAFFWRHSHKSWNHKQKLQKCSNNARYLIYIKVSFDIFLPSEKSYKNVLFHVQFSILFAFPSDKHILWYFSYKYVCTASIPFSLDRLQECWYV